MYTQDPAAVLDKILWIINDVLWINMMNWHDDWVRCWRWKVFIKVWVNMLEFFFSDQVIICLFIEFFLFNLSGLHVLFLCINKASILLGMLYMLNIVIGFIKADWVHVWRGASNFSLRRDYAFWCIIIFIEVLWPWYMFLIVLKDFSLGAFACMYNVPLKGKLSSVLSCCINSSLTLLLLSTHPRKFYFKYEIDHVLDAWKDLGWYCWLVFLCWCCWPVFLCCHCWLIFLLVGWWWFFPFWCWNIF